MIPGVTTVTPMDMDVEQVSRLKRDLARMDTRLQDLRLFILRLSVIVALVLIAVGLVLPAWSGEMDEEQVTARVVTVGFIEPSEQVDGFGTAAIIGFLGLLLVVLLLCGVLVNSVIWGNGRQGARLRNVIGTLAVIGSVIASLFSWVGWASDEPGVSGGWGPVVLLVGVITAVVILNHRPWQDLWIQQPERR
jgi:hypothetical protein